MKTKYFILALATVLVSTVFTACNQTEFDPVSTDDATTPWATTCTFSQLISNYTTTLGIHADSTRKNSGTAHGVRKV